MSVISTFLSKSPFTLVLASLYAVFKEQSALAWEMSGFERLAPLLARQVPPN